MPLFGKANCPLANLTVKVEREPASADPTFQVTVRVTKLADPDANKVWGERVKCEAEKTFKKLREGRYRVTAEVKPEHLYTFEDADAVEIDLTKKDPAESVTLKIKPIKLTAVTPAAAWKQYVNLELTDDERAAGCVLVPHDVQEQRAQAALVAANLDGLAAWIAAATQLSNTAAAKRMDPKQMGSVYVAEATVTPATAGVKVYFAVRPDGGNPAWPQAPDALRAAVSHAKAGAKDKWKTTSGSSDYVLTDDTGVAKAKVRVPRFGGDKLKIVAGLKPDPLNDGGAKTSAELTVWRKIWVQASYNKDFPLPSLAQAEADYARAFVELEAIDTRPYAIGAGGGAATGHDAWKFDEGTRKGRLKPGDTAKIEVTVKNHGTVPATATVTVTADPGGATVTREVALRRAAKLAVTEPNVDLASKPVGGAFTPLSSTFRVRNQGDAKLRYTVTKTQPWLTLSREAGTVAGTSDVAVQADLDLTALKNLAPGVYQDTLTFTNAGKPTETVTKTVKVTVAANPNGALTVSPGTGLTLLGAVGGPFAGAAQETYTLTNAGGKKLDFSVSKPAEAWLEVSYPAQAEAAEAHTKAKEAAKKADEEATTAEREAKEQDEAAKAKEDRVPKVAEEQDAKVKSTAEDADAKAKQATSAREAAKSAQADEARVAKLEEDAREARAEQREAEESHKKILARAVTPEGRGEAEREAERAERAGERASALERELAPFLTQGGSASAEAARRAREAETRADEAERAATQAAEEAKAAEEEAPRAKEAAKTEATEAREQATKKKESAEQARKKSDEAKEAETKAKDRADKGIGTLEPGATTSVTVRVKDDEAAKLGALPATATVTFKDETGNTSQARTMKVGKPGKLTVAGNDLAKTKAAGTFDATSEPYTLTNDGDDDIRFTASKTESWLHLDLEGGTLRAGQNVTVTATVDLAVANALETGNYATKIKFTDATHAVETDKDATLTVTANGSGVLALTPSEGMECIGVANGPFVPSTKIYTVKNIGGAAVSFEVTQNQAWVKTSTPGQFVPIGDHNKIALQALRQQPDNQRPRTIQLLVCQKQLDPEDTAGIDAESSTRVFALDKTKVKNDDGDAIEVAIPTIDGQPLVTGGQWEWDGHSGDLQDAWFTIERGRTSLSKVTLTLPANCPGCAKVGCAGDAIAPTGAKKAKVVDLELHGFQSFLGEGGYQDRPTCLIVSKENEVDDFNDTVSHEIGHMLMAVLHPEDHHKDEVKEAKKRLKDAESDVKKAKKKGPVPPDLAAEKTDAERAVKHSETNHEHFWVKGVPVNPIQYDEGQGNHCGTGGTPAPLVNPTTYNDGTCILYDSGRSVKLSWCADCIKYFKFTDMRRFALTE